MYKSFFSQQDFSILAFASPIRSHICWITKHDTKFVFWYFLENVNIGMQHTFFNLLNWSNTSDIYTKRRKLKKRMGVSHKKIKSWTAVYSKISTKVKIFFSFTEPSCTEEKNLAESSTKDSHQQTNVTESTVVKPDSSFDQNQTLTTTMVSLITPKWFHFHAPPILSFLHT